MDEINHGEEMMTTSKVISDETHNALIQDISEVLNKHSIDALFDTPDFMLASVAVSEILNIGFLIQARDDWFKTIKGGV